VQKQLINSCDKILKRPRTVGRAQFTGSDNHALRGWALSTPTQGNDPRPMGLAVAEPSPEGEGEPP